MLRRFPTLLLTVGMLLFGWPVGTPQAQAAPSLEVEVVCALNAHRQRLGTSTLAMNDELRREAREHAQRMADQNRLHHSPDLGSAVGGWSRLGENVGRGPTVPRVHQALLDSPGHRRNMEDGGYTEVGVGVVDRGGTVWIVQIFRQPSGRSRGSMPTCPTSSSAIVPIPLTGDWNGDGRSTAGWRVGDRFVLRHATPSGGDVTFRLGRAGDVPVVGDWNGDGRTTVGVFRLGGRWLLRNSNSRGPADHSFRFGRAGGAVPVVGDWNGNGRETIGIRYAGGRWLLRNSLSSGGANHSFRFGRRTDAVGVVGDWNADGRTTVGAWHPGGRWLLRNTHAAGGSDHAFTFGRDLGAAPITGDWNRDRRTTAGFVRADDAWLLRDRHSAGSADRAFRFSAS